MYEILIWGFLAIAIVAIAGCVDNRGTPEHQTRSATVQIVSGNMTYPAYLAAPSAERKKPAVVLIHSFNGLEPGYRNLTDNFAEEGFVVLSPEWQTFEKTPRDEVVGNLIRDSVAYLKTRPDVDPARLGLTGLRRRKVHHAVPAADGRLQVGSRLVWFPLFRRICKPIYAR